jgi:phosphoglycerol transferase MdoB-like AlkP superfamily enzyme
VCFWDEFGTRYNFIAVDYLIYTHEIIGTLKESLPITQIALILLIISAGLAWLVDKIIPKEKNPVSLWMVGLSSIPIAIAFYFHDSEFQFIQNSYSKELAKNGPYEFFSAFRHNALDYDKFYKTIDRKEAIEIVRSQILQKNQEFTSDNVITRVTNNNHNQSKHNIVMIVIESMSAEYLGIFGNRDNITPNLDRICKDGMLFTNFYATGTRTVRGLEAVTTGIPPIPGSSIIRRKDNNDLFNLASVLKKNGYNTNFVYGGFSYFDNLENYFGGNGYKITDRGSLKSEEISFSNIWGVADEDILTKALDIEDGSKPFFTLIMTTSNHRPYTFPDNRIDLPSGDGRNAAVKYTDYAIGKFLEDAKKKPWFENTIFVILADHCASSAGKTRLPVEKYHIPLVIYAPKIIASKEVSNLSSQIDLPPTILGLLGIDYESKFIGTDILNFPSNRAFISTYQLLGYLKNGKLVILSPLERVNTYSSSGEMIRDENLEKEAISFYQISNWLFFSGQMKNEMPK